MRVTSVAAYVPRGGPPPGETALLPLDVHEVMDDGIRLRGLSVIDARGGRVLGETSRLRSDPARGGGPLAAPAADASARAFALTNVAWSARRLLDVVEAELDRVLPPLRIWLGSHGSGSQRWGGGHYRVPASTYSTLAETHPVDPLGEVHLGSGRVYLEHHGAPYLHVPGHNTAIVTHEVAHHVCRHVADFRLNRLRPADQQTNRRTSVEEGTCDYLAAAMLGDPDIYGWHRCKVPVTDPRRRCLSARWTMADFRGGPGVDPHADGSIWACALWDARAHADRAGRPGAAVDGMLLHGLARLGEQEHHDRDPDVLRIRRGYGNVLSAMLEASTDAALIDHVERVMAGRGIRPGWSNAQAQEAARRWS
ncbi:MAG TPA: hypothetical protein VI248_24600 [Kineosporiaceae bacterium]